MSTAAFNFGRLNPPTTGHLRVFKALHETDADAKLMYLSHSCGPTKSSKGKNENPLDYDRKIEYVEFILEENYPDVEVVNCDANSPFDVAVDLYNKGFDDIILVVGDDRANVASLLEKYNGKPDKSGLILFKFDSISTKVIPRDESLSSDVGMSASKVRQMVVDNDFENFKMSIPTKDINVIQDLWEDLREILVPNGQITESMDDMIVEEEDDNIESIISEDPDRVIEGTGKIYSSDEFIEFIRSSLDAVDKELFGKIGVFRHRDDLLPGPASRYLFIVKPTEKHQFCLSVNPVVNSQDPDFKKIMDIFSNKKFKRNSNIIYVTTTNHLKNTEDGKYVKYFSKGMGGVDTEKFLTKDEKFKDFLEHHDYDHNYSGNIERVLMGDLVNTGGDNNKIRSKGDKLKDFLFSPVKTSNTDAGRLIADITATYEDNPPREEYISVKDFTSGSGAHIVNLGLGGRKEFSDPAEKTIVNEVVDHLDLNPKCSELINKAVREIISDPSAGASVETIMEFQDTVEKEGLFVGGGYEPTQKFKDFMNAFLEKAWFRDGPHDSYSYLGNYGNGKYVYLSSEDAYKKYAQGEITMGKGSVSLTRQGFRIGFHVGSTRHDFTIRNRGGNNLSLSLDLHYSPSKRG